jgi:hypothetical protein
MPSNVTAALLSTASKMEQELVRWCDSHGRHYSYLDISPFCSETSTCMEFLFAADDMT